MFTHFYSLVKKDVRLMISGRFFIMVISSLILYSCYINFVYAKTDVEPYRLYVYDPMKRVTETSRWISYVHTREELMEVITEGDAAIGIDYSKETAEIIQYETGNQRLDTFQAQFALAQLSGNSNAAELERLGSNSHELKLRKEMTCEVLFFEIVAVGFIGIASLLFKEKQMGVMQIYGIIPAKRILFILSKACVFLLSDILFGVVVIGINIGMDEIIPILLSVLPHITILSIIMVLLGFFFAMLYKNFKQFGFAYTFIIILMTSPIYLAANTAITWKWITYYPFYHLFMALKNAFFEMGTNTMAYYSICVLVIVIQFGVVSKMMSRELIKG